MLDQLRHALAQLVVAESRLHELVEPEKVIFDQVKGIVITLAAAYEQVHVRIANIERQLELLAKHPLIVVDVPDSPMTATEAQKNFEAAVAREGASS